VDIQEAVSKSLKKRLKVLRAYVGVCDACIDAGQVDGALHAMGFVSVELNGICDSLEEFKGASQAQMEFIIEAITGKAEGKSSV